MAEKDDATELETAVEEEKEKPRGVRAIVASPVVRIGLFVLLLGVNAVVSFVIVQMVIKPKVATETLAEEVGKPDVPLPGELYVIDNIIVNPTGTRATRYLRVAAALEYPSDEPELGAELEARSYQFRDIFITELSSRTVDELVDARVKEEIREELLARLNASISDGSLSNLYFTEYVIQ